jgi:hypothetical protein
MRICQHEDDDHEDPERQIALPRFPANGLSATGSSAAWIGSALSAKGDDKRFFIESRFK